MEQKSYILWYSSASHGKDRFFVGSEQIKVPCAEHGFHEVPKPTWTYAKEEATILTGDQEAQQAFMFATASGYKGLKLEPIDETPQLAKPKEELVH